MRKPLPTPAPHTPFNQNRRAWNDWERPDRFYDLTTQYPGGVVIKVENQASNPVFTTTADAYALPGNADIVLLRLTTPVPATAAVPVKVLTELRFEDAILPDRWVKNRTFTAAGFGRNETSGFSGQLKQATVRGAVFPCPSRRDGWTYGADHMICVTGVDGIARDGDSGGPLYWTDGAGQRWLVGVYQGIEGKNGGRYTATWYRGGSNFRSLSSAPLPNIGSWFDRHLNGEVGYQAFLWSSSTNDHYANTTYAMNPGGLDPQVIVDGTGRYRARFPGLTAYDRTIGRTVSVTAYGRDDRYCKIGDQVADDEVEVLCFDRHGRSADSLFTILSSDGGNETTAVVAVDAGRMSVRSDSRDRVSVRRSSVGRFEVSQPGNRTTWKYVAVTAAGSGSTRCHVQGWGTSTATVLCKSAGGTPTDSGFHFVATSDTEQSYAWSYRLTGRSTAPGAYANVAGQRRLPTIDRQFKGGYHVEFPGLPKTAGGTVQVSAYGSTSNHCKVRGWTSTAAAVWCYDTRGNPVDTRFTVRYVDPVDTGMFLETRLSWLRGLSSDGCGEHDFVGSVAYTAGATGRRTFGEVEDRSIRRFTGRSAIPLAATSEPGARFVTVNVRVTDVDGWFCGSDDVVDIAPGPKVADLRLRVDLYRHRIEVLDPDASIRTGLGLLTTSGRHGDEQAIAGLQIEVARPTGVVVR